MARYNAGEDTPALSREFGISKSGLLQLVHAEGVTFRKQSVTPEDAERAVQLYEAGLTIKQVVSRIGYSSSTIQRLLNENGVTMRASWIGNRIVADE